MCASSGNVLRFFAIQLLFLGTLLIYGLGTSTIKNLAGDTDSLFEPSQRRAMATEPTLPISCVCEISTAEVCDRYFSDRRQNVGVSACGMRVYICPFGREE